MEYYHLAQMQDLPLEAKIIKSQLRIREWYEHWEGNVYISISGKDSAVVYNLVREMYPDVPAVFCDTGVEWPEVRDYIKTLENVDWIRPDLNFKEIVETHGYPVVSKEQASYIWLYRNSKSEELRNKKWEGVKSEKTGKQRFKISEKWKFLVDAPFQVSDKCCDYLKKKPFHKYAKKTKDKPRRHPIMGVMAHDSNQRKGQYLKHGCNAFDLRSPRSHPIGFWTEQDVLRYIRDYNIPYPSIYGDIVEQHNGTLRVTGQPHTGCIYCLFGFQYTIGESKFEVLKRLHPAKYKYCMEKLGIKEVLDFVNDHMPRKYRVPY